MDNASKALHVKSLRDSLKDANHKVDLERFLKKLHVVNFFRVYRASGAHKSSCPSLSTFLKQVLKSTESVSSKYPLYLFTPESSLNNQKLLALASPEVFQTLCDVVIGHIEREIDELSQEKDKQVVRDILHDIAFIPIHKHSDSVVSDSLLVAPSAAVKYSPGFQLCEHFAYVISSSFGVRECRSYGDLNSSELRDIFCWMSRQSNMYCSISMMQHLLKELVKDKHKNSSLIRDMLSTDKPFIWFPDDRDSNDDQKHLPGKFYRLSDVVLGNVYDETEKFSLLEFSGCPIRSLRRHYKESEIRKMFSREKYCNFCKLSEGLYSHQGQTFDQPVSGSEDLRCSCVLHEQSLEKLYGVPCGIVKTAVSLSQCSKILLELRKLYDTEEYTKNKIMFILKSWFEKMNRALSKCLSTKMQDGIWPYSPSDLDLIRQEWMSHAFWPSVDTGTFFNLNCPDSITLVLENRDMYTPFKDKLTEAAKNLGKPIRVLDLNFFEPAGNFPAINYSEKPAQLLHLEQFQDVYKDILQRSPEDVIRFCEAGRGQYIDKTLLLAMVEFLPNIYSFGSRLQTRPSFQSSDDQIKLEKRFVDRLEMLCVLVLIYLKNEDETSFDGLQGRGEFHKLLQLQVKVVSNLCMRSELDLGFGSDSDEMIVVSEYKISDTYRKELESPELLLDDTLKLHQVSKICKSFIDDHLITGLLHNAKVNRDELNKFMDEFSKEQYCNLKDKLIEEGYNYEVLSKEEFDRVKMRRSGINNALDENDDMGEEGASAEQLERVEKFRLVTEENKASKREFHVASAANHHVTKPVKGRDSNDVTLLVDDNDSIALGAKTKSVSDIDAEDLNNPNLTIVHEQTEGGSLSRRKEEEEEEEEEEEDDKTIELSFGGGIISNSSNSEAIREPPASMNRSPPPISGEVHHINPSSPGSSGTQEPSQFVSGSNTFIGAVHNNSSGISNVIELDAQMMRKIFEELLSEQCGISLERMSSVNSTEENNSPLSNMANLHHGRIGEQLAFGWLKMLFPELRCEWMNVLQESSKPYDFIIYDEHDKIVRYVEVKTRVGDSVNQWIISRNEMHFAASTASIEKSQYSCFLIHMVRDSEDENNKALAPKNMKFVENLLVDSNGKVVKDSLIDFTVRINSQGQS